jgi:hypothetical protein
MIPNPLSTLLSTYCNVNAIEMIYFLRDDIRDKKISKKESELFKKQLLYAIKNKTITIEEYKKLTGENEYLTQDDLQKWLKEFFVIIFVNEARYKTF